MELRRSYLRRHRRKQVVHDCATAAPAMFGRHEPASLFLSRDSRENQFSQEATSHEGVLVCATCERAPAVVTCIADAAALCAISAVCVNCAVCDAEIHSVSSLACRHHHTPVLTFHPPGGSDIRTEKACTNPFTNDADKDDAFFPSEEVNQYLNLTELDDLDAELQPMCSERVVPFSRAMAEEQQQKHHLDASTFPLFGYSESFNNSVSVPSMKAITVPDVAAAAMNGLPVGCHQPQIQLPQFSSLDRKARVLRYKEKKKARNFEKTIRYATRKAYAEARPRIRGRFARRSDAVADAGKKFSSSATSEDGYGIVPSFS